MSIGYSLRLAQRNRAADQSLLGVRLGAACISRDVPVTEVAARLGVSKQAVYRWFIGDSSPAPERVDAVASLLHSLQ